MGALLAGVVALGGRPAPWALADDAGQGVEPHQGAAATRRSTADYKVPPVKLVRDDGKTVSLADELNDERPVIMNFIFTTCTAICPVMSRVFSQLQSKLGDDRDKVHMVSISIDPEQDTPGVWRNTPANSRLDPSGASTRGRRRRASRPSERSTSIGATR